jgi:hypothetical protein
VRVALGVDVAQVRPDGVGGDEQPGHYVLLGELERCLDFAWIGELVAGHGVKSHRQRDPHR